MSAVSIRRQAAAFAQALAGVPIVITQRLIQRIGDTSSLSQKRVEQQISTARVVGKMAVKLGSRQLGSKFSGLIGSLSDLTDKPLAARTPEKFQSTDLTPDLAIAQYATLRGADIVAQLWKLSPTQLQAILEYETTHRSRRTVVAKIAQLIERKQTL